MTSNCCKNDSNVFFDNIKNRFNSFKKKVKQFSKKSNIEFNEDVFMDTLIKCSNTFQNKDATDNDIDLYFFKSYKQNIITEYNKNIFDKDVEIEKFEDIFIDETYNYDIDEIISIIKNEVKNEFGDDVYNAWILHVCNDYTYEELIENGFENLNLHNEFRQIKRHILQKYINKNKTLKQLLKENNFI